MLMHEVSSESPISPAPKTGKPRQASLTAFAIGNHDNKKRKREEIEDEEEVSNSDGDDDMSDMKSVPIK